MPELPEVEALRVFLDDHLVGKEIARVLPLAISVLKTYDPPLSALTGGTVTSVSRHGKFLDIQVGPLHLVTHLARAGWLQWKDSFPATPPRPGKGPLALRTVLSGGDGFDLTEMGTTKRLAVHLVRDPRRSPASPGSGRIRSPTPSTATRSPPSSTGNAARSRAPCATSP